MAQQLNDDLFEGTKMTFGEHLEELRVCLFRAIVGVVIGCLIGFAFANQVVRWVQTPLKSALQQHYQTRTVETIRQQYDLDDDKLAVVKGFVNQHNLTYDEVFLERRDIQRMLDAASNPTDEQTQEELTRELPLPDDHQLMKTRVWRPLDPRITTLNAQEAFMIWLKAAFAFGALLASPYVFYQIWLFVSAGLYPHEKRYVYLFLPISLVLFWSGAAMAFFVVFKYVLNFLLQFNARMDIHSEPRISEWISFVLMLPLGFGVAFQLPLVMLFIQRLGIITIEQFLDKWRVAVLVICVISMFLTPADPISMVMMAAPLVALYFLGIGFCKWMPRGRNPYAEAYEP